MIVFLLLLYCLTGAAQRIKVIDNTTLQPVDNVFIFDDNHQHSTLTNRSGQADFDMFGEDDIIIFQHPSYQKEILEYTDVQMRDFIIKLQPSAIDLQSVVVSSSKWEQKRSEIPNKIVQLQVKELSLFNPQTTADLLQASNEIFVQKSQLGGGSPMIRGFAANSLLIVVDGVRMNNAIYRSGNLQNVLNIDYQMLESAEVIMGPGSVVYGSDALGGVMDFHSQLARLGSEGETYIASNGMSRFSSANYERTLHADVNIGWEKWSLVSGISFSQFGDLRSGTWYPEGYPVFGKRHFYVDRINGKDSIIENDKEQIQRYSGYKQYSAMQKIRFKPNNRLNFVYGFHFSRVSDIPRYDRLIQEKNGSLKYAEWYYGPQQWMMHNIATEIRNVSNLFDEARITLAYQDYQESRHDRKLHDDYLRHRNEMVDVYTVNIDMDKDLNKKSSLFYGLEGVFNQVKSEAITEDIVSGDEFDVAPRYPSGGSSYSTMAAYGLYKRNVSSKFTLNAGIRYSHVIMDADFSGSSLDNYALPYNTISLNTGALNGLAGMVYRPDEHWQFKLNASSGFRAPNIDDVAKVFDSEPGNVVVPNDDLQPEYVYNLEGTIIRKIGESVQLELTGYYTWLENAMVRRNFMFNGQDSIMYDSTMSKVQAVVNASSAIIYGASAKIKADISSNWTASAYYTITEGEDNEGIPLRHVPPAYGNLTFTYQAEKFRGTFYTNFNQAKKLSDMAPSEQAKTHLYTDEGTPAWYTLNVMLSYQISNTTRISAGCENITDLHYRPYSSGISAPGRNFVIAIKGNFNNLK